ncbi:MAG TPA: hypothetical protein VGD83_27280 [Streptosporangiaceae bacterium]
MIYLTLPELLHVPGTEEPWQIEFLRDGLLTGPCHGPVQRR